MISLITFLISNVVFFSIFNVESIYKTERFTLSTSNVNSACTCFDIENRKLSIQILKKRRLEILYFIPNYPLISLSNFIIIIPVELLLLFFILASLILTFFNLFTFLLPLHLLLSFDFPISFLDQFLPFPLNLFSPSLILLHQLYLLAKHTSDLAAMHPGRAMHLTPEPDHLLLQKCVLLL